MSIFSVNDEIKRFAARVAETLDKVDALVLQSEQLVLEVRAELACVKRGREAMGTSVTVDIKETS
jgi:F0F1-type ATP synthase membrane subunit b/b'